MDPLVPSSCQTRTTLDGDVGGVRGQCYRELFSNKGLAMVDVILASNDLVTVGLANGCMFDVLVDVKNLVGQWEGGLIWEGSHLRTNKFNDITYRRTYSPLVIVVREVDDIGKVTGKLLRNHSGSLTLLSSQINSIIPPLLD